MSIYAFTADNLIGDATFSAATCDRIGFKSGTLANGSTFYVDRNIGGDSSPGFFFNSKSLAEGWNEGAYLLAGPGWGFRVYVSSIGGSYPTMQPYSSLHIDRSTATLYGSTQASIQGSNTLGLTGGSIYFDSYVYITAANKESRAGIQANPTLQNYQAEPYHEALTLFYDYGYSSAFYAYDPRQVRTHLSRTGFQTISWDKEDASNNEISFLLQNYSQQTVGKLEIKRTEVNLTSPGSINLSSGGSVKHNGEDLCTVAMAMVLG